MTQHIRIELLERKTVKTQYGMKEKWYVNARWDSFIGDWNKHWQVGMEVDADVVGRVYQGRTYYDLKPPQNNSSKLASTSTTDAWESVLATVDLLRKQLQELRHK